MRRIFSKALLLAVSFLLILQPIAGLVVLAQEAQTFTLYYKGKFSNPHAHYQVGTGTWTTLPGEEMVEAGGGYYKLEINMGSGDTLKVAFNDAGKAWDNNNRGDYKVPFGSGSGTVADGKVIDGKPAGVSDSNSNTKPDSKESVAISADGKIPVFYRTTFANAYIHYSVDGKWTALPGIKLENASVNGYKYALLDIADGAAVQAAFNDGATIWDNNSRKDYRFTAKASGLTFDNGQVREGVPAGVKINTDVPAKTEETAKPEEIVKEIVNEIIKETEKPVVVEETPTPVVVTPEPEVVEEIAEETEKPVVIATKKPVAKVTAKPTVKPTVRPTSKVTLKTTTKPSVKATTKPVAKTTVKPNASKPTMKPATTKLVIFKATPKPVSKKTVFVFKGKGEATTRPVVATVQTKRPTPVVTASPEPTEVTPEVTEQVTEKPTEKPATPVPTTKPATPKPATPKPVNGNAGKTFTWDNATVYFVMTDRFENGDTSNDSSYGRPRVDGQGKNIGTFHGGDLKGLTKKLNDGYFEKLGINAIWITAPYEQAHGFVAGGDNGDFAHYAYHGYYVLDYTAVDQNMGTVEDMRTFVDTAHKKGIRVLLDIVMNHAGYHTIQDIQEYNFAKLSSPISKDWKPNGGENWFKYHDSIDYKDAAGWANWWGPWVRAGLPGYETCPNGGDEIKQCLSFLPDFRTDLTTSVGVAPILKTKWQKEASGYDKWIVPAAKDMRKDLNLSPAASISKWLSAWVEEFGIDGFRVDTAKHVEKNNWAMMKKDAEAALKKWRSNNPDDPASKWTDNFWMVGEVWGHGVNKSDYFTNGGFDALINFSFQSVDVNNLETTFGNYDRQLNSDPSFNVLNYISSHDTSLYDRNNLMKAGTALLLAPGAAQIYYGDETARPMGPNGSDKYQGTRSYMNWDNVNQGLLTHWQKLGAFRNNHISIGAGQHKKLSDAPYTFSRSVERNGVKDAVVVAIGATGSASISVDDVFEDGATVRDAYSGKTATVSGGKVSIQADASGIVLLESAE